MYAILRVFAIVFILFAQSVEYRLDTQRNFGYGAGSNVNGNFTNRIYGPAENIQSVTYMIDGTVMAEVSEPPFEFRYSTTSYAVGWHDLSAVIKTKDGREVTTPTVRLNFLSSDQMGQDMGRIMIPLLGGIALATILGLGVQFLFLRRNPVPAGAGAPRNYGLLGGTICPRCGRAYPLHFWSLRLVVVRLDRCDYCGKWALVTRKPPEILAAAELAERAAVENSESSLPGVQNGQSEDEKMKKLLDDSRYSE